MEKLKKRILEISKKLGLAHIGSCLSVLPILCEIYEKRQPEDIVLMDNGHASLAWYVVLESLGGKNAEEMIKKHGIHANRDVENGIYASNGSLGHNVGISIGLSLANKTHMIYVIISDGSSCEGTLAESLRIARILNIKNIEIHANFNGYTAVSEIDISYWEQFIRGFGYPIIFHRTNNGLKELDGVRGHYLKLNEITKERTI